MKLALVILIVLTSCSPAKKIQNVFADRPESKNSEVIESIIEKEGTVHLSEDNSAWKIFGVIFLLVAFTCTISGKHEYIKKAYKSLKVRLDKGK